MKLNMLEKLLIKNPMRDFFLRSIEAPRLFNAKPITQQGICLEIGCGSGAGSFSAHRYLKPALLVSVDIDMNMLKTARKRYFRLPAYNSDEQVSGTGLVLSDAGCLPFSDEIFDVGFHFFVFDHLPDWRHVIHELYRVLKYGGVYMFEEYLIPDSRYNMNRFFGHVSIERNELNDAFREAGFSIEENVYSGTSRHFFMRVYK